MIIVEAPSKKLSLLSDENTQHFDVPHFLHDTNILIYDIFKALLCIFNIKIKRARQREKYESLHRITLCDAYLGYKQIF